MVFAEFQHKSTGWNGKDFSGPAVDIPMCGSDGVYVCDGRMKLASQIEAAKNNAKLKNKKLNMGITGLIMQRGTFSDSKPITKFIPLESAY